MLSKLKETCIGYKNTEVILLCNILVPFMLCFNNLGRKHRVEIPTQTLYLKSPEFFCPLIRQPLK